MLAAVPVCFDRKHHRLTFVNVVAVERAPFDERSDMCLSFLRGARASRRRVHASDGGYRFFGGRERGALG